MTELGCVEMLCSQPIYFSYVSGVLLLYLDKGEADVTVSSIYIWKQAQFFILAADQNIFNECNEYGLIVQYI